MKKNIQGQIGEAIAKKYLHKNHYKIIDMNFKTPAGEIDIIATDKRYLIFIEVKLRTSLSKGYPREAVDKYKQNKIRLVATQYLKLHILTNIPIRFDVIEIVGDEHNHTIEHIIDAF